MTQSKRRLRGLKDLVVDAVEHGSSAVERVHLATAKRTFDVLEALPGVALPSKGVHVVHDLSVKGVYGAIRLVNRAVGAALDVAIDAASPDEAPPAAGAASPRQAHEPEPDGRR